MPAAPSQLPKPASQVTPQAPETQAPRALGPPGQAVPQAPQLEGSRASSASQPVAARPSQSAKRARSRQATAQTPALQTASPLGPSSQAWPHSPQWRGSLRGSTQDAPQCSGDGSRQSTAHANDRLPPVMRTSQRADAPSQRVPHAPQWAGSERSVSHPLAGSPSQSAKPSSQAEAQAPAAQAARACGAEAQRVAQAPQCSGSRSRSASQPSRGVALQSAVRGAHASTQSPPAQVW